MIKKLNVCDFCEHPATQDNELTWSNCSCHHVYCESCSLKARRIVVDRRVACAVCVQSCHPLLSLNVTAYLSPTIFLPTKRDANFYLVFVDDYDEGDIDIRYSGVSFNDAENVYEAAIKSKWKKDVVYLTKVLKKNGERSG